MTDLLQYSVWIPDNDFIKKTNISKAMTELKMRDYQAFHRFSVEQVELFWSYVINKLGVIFHVPPKKICDLQKGVEFPNWLLGATLNIIESCFTAPSEKTAILFRDVQGGIKKLSYGELNKLAKRIANSLVHCGLMPGDAIAICMPMNELAVAIYLGIIKMGGIVVSIADSFSTYEIETRLKIAKSKAIFTQDIIKREGKEILLYEKLFSSDSPLAIVLSYSEIAPPLRKGDVRWENFLMNNTDFSSYIAKPMEHCNILFSSGTTGVPKAIPWNHTTAIKVASDAFFHHNIQSEDILAWPTNLGWMMGPWLIFAAFMNRATIALYDDVPRSRLFGEFIQNAKVTMLGVVPTLVANWRQSRCMEGLDWSSIKLFSSTGECSNSNDMAYLMALAGNKPIIEYCGGTEIGGSYITSTLIEKNYPSLCSTPALGLDFVLLNETGKPTDSGEVAIIPPSIGLSTELLNANHYEIYYENMPLSPDGKILRRHGDHVQRLPNGYYSILGRIDDTMNLGGVKVSAAEIERVLSGIENILETAAIAVSSPHHGPSQLVIYATTKRDLNKDIVQSLMQKKINQHLNPLFKINDVVFIDALPKTASNKVMRRMLREKYSLSSSYK